MSTNGEIWFSSVKLAKLGLAKVIPGMARSEKGARETAKRLHWPSRMVDGLGGKGGKRTEYRPPADVLELIHLFLDANPDFFKEKRGKTYIPAPNQPTHKIQESAPPDYNYVSIPLYDVRAAAGGGAVVDSEQVIDVLHFKQEWIRTELRASPSDLYLIYVDGESMEPTLRPGDIILVDNRDQAQARDGIYVMRMNGTLLVKRLQRLPGGVIKVSSDNPAYTPYEIKAESIDDGFAIIGRVVWTGRRI